MRMEAIPEAVRAEETSSDKLSGSPTVDNGSVKGSELDSIKSSQHEPGSSTFFDDPNWDSDGFDLEDDSPYPEVRSAVANTDDPTMPVSTLRAWVIGMLLAMIFAGVNQFFIFRYPSIYFTAIVPQLLSYPIGRAAAAYIPRNWTLFGLELNPGPFSIKEHVLITVMASVGSGSAYATDIIAVQRVFYNQVYNFSYQWFLVLSTQLIGFSIGGIARHILVEPPSMIWPARLVSCALFNTLHSEHYTGIGIHGGMSRNKFFWKQASGLTIYPDFLPGYLFRALSYFSWVTWIWPENAVIAQLFGYINGLGFSVLTFDWNQIAYVGSPLVTPWWAQANVIVGFIFFYWILTPILYFSNVWFAQYMPIMSKSSFDNRFQPYNVTRILSADMLLDLQAYKDYSPLFLSTTFALAYGLSFATITATLSHSFLYYRKQIWRQARRSLREQPDIHARLMSQYPQVPDWWYYVTFVVPFALGVISIELWPTHMPVWALILAIVIALLYVVPAGIVEAITNQRVALNVITELIIGYALPGRPIAMMMFKTWGYITLSQALIFTADMKLGHYMKVPARPLFWAQVIGTIVAGTTQLGVQSWMFTHIPQMCSSEQPDGPIVFAGTNLLPPATAINYVPSAIVGFVFQYLIKKHRFAWWTKYNYVLSAALDSGVAISVIIIYFALEYPNLGAIGRDTIGKWWGNTVPFTGADGRGTPLRSLPPEETFGLRYESSMRFEVLLDAIKTYTSDTSIKAAGYVISAYDLIQKAVVEAARSREGERWAKMNITTVPDGPDEELNEDDVDPQRSPEAPMDLYYSPERM
ncbi:hypothetical protein PQX77_012115 [Marasmius sp. AFHP31]|nr:hypothetical protein PQX77_012115 [Marasmius sp. AFHP31]